MASSKSDVIQKPLEYRIYKYSSYSATFVPENIIINKPSDQASRWSSDNNNHPQYLVLKLQQPAILQTITFGKYEKTHVCNLKKFKIYGGLEEGRMMELLESGLKNDSLPETFDLKRGIGNRRIHIPVRFVKILPLKSWGPSFNFSIWHIQLSGIDDPSVVKPCIEWINSYQQKEIIRLCMKHFRKFEQQEIVEKLLQVTGVSLEDPRLTILYDILVKRGDHSTAENFITNAVNDGLLNDYINAQSYRAVWTKIESNKPKPGMRGGHQMVLDTLSDTLYLFGGWDGNTDLADLWAYDIPTEKWRLICKDTEEVGGPKARSCHKMCLDPKRRQIFALGRYLDTQYRTLENLKSDFYVYNIEKNVWTLISEDTGVRGGPKLIFDHQMSIDIEMRTIYVFGGRILISPINSEDQEIITNSTEPKFSGLYSYHVPTDTWCKLASDIASPDPQINLNIKSRVGHSMLFHPESRKLYIFAGQRSKEYLNDFFTYQVDTAEIEQISMNDFGNQESNRVPAAGFTQRATIDPELKEIYVLSGLNKDKDKRDDNVQNSFWVYNIEEGKWSCIYRNENIGEKYWNKMQDYEPCPRFAYQFIYDHVKKVHFLFGGNPGRTCLPKLRLDDFWILKLSRPSHEQVLKHCKLIIRKQKFQELAMKDTMQALEYLQTKVSEIIDHNDEEQLKEFQLLASVLFQEPCTLNDEFVTSNDTSLYLDSCDDSGNSEDDVLARNVHARRTDLYDKLTEFFPEALSQPRSNLMDLLPL